jgi:cell fate regulator YaaT (PSP1 superfamily)
MIKVVGIRFQRAGKIYYFDPLDYDLETAMHVIVETARGVEMGTVLIPPKEVDDDKVVQPLKPVIRIATDDDEKVIEKNKEKEAEAYVICKEKIAKHGLDMKLVAAEYTFDNNKLLFYFTADGRIDFRELVKDLASVFRTRIELRQIGVRDETKMLGGIGICGRELCCRSYLTDFVPVSIKMAKEQNLSLNPTKISGVCGRLMCCLKNEQETYEYLNSRLPSVGDSVITPTGMHGEVSGVNVLRQLVKVVVDNGEEKELQEYAVDDLKFTSRRRRDVRVTDEEMKELEGLEDNGSTEEENERPQRENRRENNRGKYRREQNDASPETDVGSESRENREKNDSGEKREYRDRSNYRGKKREYRDRNDNGEKREYRERSNYRGRNYNRDRGENADRENSGEGGEKREYRGERNFRRHRNYDRKNYQGGNNERGEQKRGDNPQS